MTLVLQPPSFPLEEKNLWRHSCSERPEPKLNCSGAPVVRNVPKTTHNMLPLSIPGSPVGKRKLELATPSAGFCDDGDYRPPTKRVSPFLNTPKQRRDERRKLYRMSLNKLRQIDDSEAFLRRSVLINNLARRMQKELRDEKLGRYPSPPARAPDQEMMMPCARRSRSSALSPPSSPVSSVVNAMPSLSLPPPVTPPPPSMALHAGSLFDDAFSLNDKITDDMSETLMRTVDALGGTITSATSPQEEFRSCSVTPLPTPASSTPQDMCLSSIDCSGMTERDRQILGEMDAVFNSLLSMFAESVETQHGS